MKKILVVDNDQFFLEFIKELLEKEGHTVQVARNGLAALDVLDGFTPDLVFSDAIMPNIDGKRLCRMLRQMDHLPHTKIVIVSGIMKEDEEELKKCGADSFVSKGPLPEMAASILDFLKPGVSLFGTSAEFVQKNRFKPRAITRELLSVNQHLELLLDRLSEAVFEIMPDGRIVYANSAATRLTGISEEGLLGRLFQNIFSEKDRMRVETLLAQVDEYPGKISDDPLPSVNGSEVLMELVPLSEGNGKTMAIIEDVREREWALRALEKSEERYRCLVEQSLQGLVIAQDDPVRLTFVSKPMEAIIGYKKEELELFGPSELMELIHPEDRERFFESFRARLSGGDVPPVNEYRILHKTKGTRWVELYSTGISYEGAPATHTVFLDITDRKTAEEKSEALEKELRQSLKMESVGRLAGGVAHDFNNNLAVILGYTEIILAQMNSNNSFYKDIQKIHEAGERSAALTKQLLAFARKQTISPRVLDLNEAVEGMLKMLRRLIGENIELVWHPDTKLRFVRMDPSQIDQILANLCVNSADAIEGAGKILIETKNVVVDNAYVSEHRGCLPGEYVMLVLTDDGSGMDRETAAHVFEPFFTTKEVGTGTGLGLATVYGIVKQNNGFINVYSEPGEGTSFKVYLPAHQKNTNLNAQAPPPLPAQGGGETILLVEDDPSILEMGMAMLQTLGYAVISADRPDKALSFARESSDPIHLLMTDVVMPLMSGKELAGQISRIRPEMRILFTSGYTADVIAQQGVLDDDVCFIEKPFSIFDLADKVSKVLQMKP